MTKLMTEVQPTWSAEGIVYPIGEGKYPVKGVVTLGMEYVHIELPEFLPARSGERRPTGANDPKLPMVSYPRSQVERIDWCKKPLTRVAFRNQHLQEREI